MKTHEEIQARIIRTNIKKAFGDLPLEAINKLPDRKILSQKHVGIKTFIYIRSNGTKTDYAK